MHLIEMIDMKMPFQLIEKCTKGKND
jgi:hypothetical protein